MHPSFHCFIHNSVGFAMVLLDNEKLITKHTLLMLKTYISEYLSNVNYLSFVRCEQYFICLNFLFPQSWGMIDEVGTVDYIIIHRCYEKASSFVDRVMYFCVMLLSS